MDPNAQLQPYQKLLQFLDAHFHEPISSKDIEQVAHYSYRNINRIFLALQHETIGQYLKRRKLEKAAEYLKFSDRSISALALDVGYQDLAAFSKAFKKHFGAPPSAFREAENLRKSIIQNSIVTTDLPSFKQLAFTIEELPDLDVLYLTQTGALDDLKQIQKTWSQLLAYANKHQLLNEQTIALGEVFDDDEITENINCRYNAAIVLAPPLQFSAAGFFATKTIPAQRYAKFLHQGPHHLCDNTYTSIFRHWMTEVQLEFADMPMLEFYLNDEADTKAEDLLLEIYIPVL